MKIRNINIYTALIISVLFFASCNQQSKQQKDNEGYDDIEFTTQAESETMEMYIKLMSSFNPNWEVEEPAAEDYPAYFGGAFISNDNKLVVCIVGDTVQYRKEVEDIIGSNDFMTESCQYSYREMMEVMDKIDIFLSDETVSHDHPFIINFAGAIADVFENRVVIRMTNLDDDIIGVFKKDITDSQIVKFEEGEMPEMM